MGASNAASSSSLKGFAAAGALAAEVAAPDAGAAVGGFEVVVAD
jgi:hypothetical protein